MTGTASLRLRLPMAPLPHSPVPPSRPSMVTSLFRRALVTVETAAWSAATALASVPKEDDMAKDYSPERIATMTFELLGAARELGIPLTEARAGDLITVLLEASARCSADTGTRAAGSFSTFLSGCTTNGARDGDAEYGSNSLALVDELVNGLSRETE